jgi:hypothetical protein
MENSAPKEWNINIRPYDPSEPPKHYDITHEYSGFNVTSKDVSKHQGFLTFVAKMTKKLISSGFNVLNLTLPSVMLSNMSSAEVILHGLGNIALFASEAAKVEDSLQRMKLLQAGVVSNLCGVLRLIEANPPYPNFHGGTLQVSL